MLKIRGFWFGLAASAGLVAGSVTLAMLWQSHAQRRLLAGWNERIVSLDEARAADYIHSLRRHDRLAIAPLAAAMADKRPAVAQAACEEVANLLADWKTLPASEAVPRLTELADHLANHYASLAPARQQFVRQLAQTMLVWPLRDADFPADELVAQCERILALPAPLLADVEASPVPTASQSAEDNSLPPIVAPEVASRPRAATLPPSTDDGTDQQEPAPVVSQPKLLPPGSAKDPSAPSDANPTDPRPREPRQFIRPRVPPIPAPDQP